ncbi:MAG: hypothetical protein ACFCVD_00895 [Nodosilinea sp.]
MSSAEQNSSQKIDSQASKASEQGRLEMPPERPTLVSPPQRPVRPVRPAVVAKPERVILKPEPKPTTAPAAGSGANDYAAKAAAPEVAAAVSRYQPIAPPSEPMQYRAIGLVRGTYEPTEADQLNRGNLTTDEGHVIDAVLLGRVTSLIKKHIDLTTSHLWVVYPRTRREMDNDDEDLHLQIVGVWEPETLGLPGELPAGLDSEPGAAASPPDIEPSVATDTAVVTPAAEPPTAPDPADLPPVDDNFFSIRGEVVKYSPDEEAIAVKILQGMKRTPGSSKPFKLMIHGTIEGRTVGYFWDFKVKREAKILVLQEAAVVGIVPPKKRGKGEGARRGKPPGRSGPGGSRPMPSRRPVEARGSERPKKRESSRESGPGDTGRKAD